MEMRLVGIFRLTGGNIELLKVFCFGLCKPGLLLSAQKKHYYVH